MEPVPISEHDIQAYLGRPRSDPATLYGAAPKAKILSSLELAKSIREGVAARVGELQQRHPSFHPCLAVVEHQERDSSEFVLIKAAAASQCNIDFRAISISPNSSWEDVAAEVARVNSDPCVHGILIQVPMLEMYGSHGEKRIVESISPEKDVDGLHPQNIGLLTFPSSQPLFAPCIAAGAVRLLESHTDVQGKHCVVVGNSQIVAAPVAAILRRRNAIVSHVDDRAPNVAAIIGTADIVVAASGKPHSIKASWLSPNAVVIDAGINFLSSPQNEGISQLDLRMVGDVEPKAAEVVDALSPVPGGVGPMMVALLMEHTLQAAERHLGVDHRIGHHGASHAHGADHMHELRNHAWRL